MHFASERFLEAKRDFFFSLLIIVEECSYEKRDSLAMPAV